MQSLVKKTNGQDLSAFRTILDFVTNLYEYFGKDKHSSIHPLNLYYRLISSMSFKDDDDLIIRHVQVFKNFCVANRSQIVNRDCDFVESLIVFSDKIYIDLEYIFKKSDEETTKVLWEYILTISAYVDPENGSKDLLVKGLSDDSKEGSFLADMIQTIDSQMGSQSVGDNPMEMIGGLLGSDMFTNLVDTMKTNVDNGSLDLEKLLGNVTGLVNKVKTEIEMSDDPLLKNMINMIQLPPQ